MSYYVKVKHQPVLYPPACVCIPTGKTRTEGNGTEAQFICIDPFCSEREIWATADKLEK